MPPRVQPYKNADKMTLAVYCHGYTAEPWTGEFAANQRLSDVVSAIWKEELSRRVRDGTIEQEEVDLYHIVSANCDELHARATGSMICFSASGHSVRAHGHLRRPARQVFQRE